MQSRKRIVIAGAGLVGSLLAIYLVRRGYNVTVLERRGDMRREQGGGGRSINLALSDRGLLALQRVGLADAIRDISIPMHGRRLHQPDGSIAFQPYGKEGQYINSVSRATLNMKLMDLAEAAGASFLFNQPCTSVDWHHNILVSKQDAQEVHYPFDVLFGADGAFSATRMQHQVHHSRFDYQQFYIDCGYKELTIPPTADGNFAMDPNALHIWPRKNYMLIALPNLDRTFTCTLFFPFEGEYSFARLTTSAAVKEFFEETFPDAVALMPGYEEEFFKNPTSSLVTVKCYPWTRGGSFSLIGDAAHAIVPFFGQGMNCGFEDCRILDELMDAYPDSWELVFENFQQLRKPDADAIADLAVANFAEMRDKTANPQFLLQKKIEARLHARYPDKWIPAYSQVTFSPHIRYSEALRRGAMQEAIMEEVMKIPGIENNWESDAVEQVILSKLEANPL